MGFALKLVALSFSLATSGVTALVHAQSPSDRAAAESLFTQGRVLMEKGEYGLSCQRLEASQALEPAVGTLLNLGLCFRRAGKLASAWGAYSEAATMARRAGDAGRRALAEGEVTSLRSSVGRVLISVRSFLPGQRVQIDGVERPVATWNTVLPMDAGPHEIFVSASQHYSWSRRFTSRDGQLLTVEVPALKSNLPATSESRPAEAPDPGSFQRNLGLGVALVGVIPMSAGVVMLGTSETKTAGTVVAVSGLGLVALGMALWLSAEDPASAHALAARRGESALLRW